MKLKTEDVTLQASDILFVPDSTGKKALHRAGDIAVSLTTGIAIVGCRPDSRRGLSRVRLI